MIVRQWKRQNNAGLEAGYNLRCSQQGPPKQFTQALGRTIRVHQQVRTMHRSPTLFDLDAQSPRSMTSEVRGRGAACES